jgi:glycosyltransferase involved in cell wall biosynthesis
VAVVTVGRLQPQKAHEHLIDAAALLAARHPDLAVRYLVVGEEPRQAELEALAAAAGLAGRMRFLGARRDVPSLLAAADLCCLTSRYEGFSNVVLECLVMGVPVVSTDAGGVREAIEEGRSGWIVPVGDVAGLADRIASLARDAGLRQAMGQAARARGARPSPSTPTYRPRRRSAGACWHGRHAAMRTEARPPAPVGPCAA